MSIYQLKRKAAASALYKESQSGLGRGLPVRDGLVSFVQDTAGDVAIIFGLMATTLFMLIGGAVDLGRWLNARDHTMAAIDSAILAGGRTLQTRTANQTTAQAEAAAVAMAKRYYDQAVLTRVSIIANSDNVTFQVVDNGKGLTAIGNAQISTPFMGFAGIKTLPLLNTKGADAQKAVLEQGGNIEVAVMLDTSGSMGETTATGSTKIADMKLAATDLVNIVVPDYQGEYKSRVALVPFSGDVRLPSSWMASVTIPNPLASIGLNPVYQLASSCVAERTGTNKYTDAAPGIGSYILNVYTTNASCSQYSTDDAVVAMSMDKAMLNTKISQLDLGGGTAGHIGTAWAYYMLSPNWASVVPTASAPTPYNTPKTQKVAILMTDGEYNYTHDSSGRPGGNSANGSTSAAQAMNICTQMKANNIVVYTIGFDLQGNTTAINTLKNCATNDPLVPGDDHFYDAADGNALRAAFRDIGLKISKLHLAQ